MHLCDGLDRHCFQILPRLPKGKSFLLSGDECAQELARSQGFRVLTSFEELDEVVRLESLKR